MAGDEVIRNLSEMLLTAFRTDVVGRMGGEEFAVVMLNTDSQQAYIKTEYFRKAVEKNIIIFEQHKLRVTDRDSAIINELQIVIKDIKDDATIKNAEN